MHTYCEVRNLLVSVVTRLWVDNPCSIFCRDKIYPRFRNVHTGFGSNQATSSILKRVFCGDNVPGRKISHSPLPNDKSKNEWS